MNFADNIRLAVLAAIAGGMLAQTPAVINVSDHRPLTNALDAIEQAFGLAINYEDVPYENPADLEDVSTAQQRASHPGYRLMVPRKGTLTVTLMGVTSPSGLWMGVNGLLNNYRLNKLPGDFTVEQANGMLYVIPTRILTKAGSVQAVASPMAVPVTMPYAERRVIDTVASVLEAVNKATGAKIEVGTLPFPPTAMVGFSASGERARDVLAALFAKLTTRPVSYRLLFDPTLRSYMLNVQAKRDAVPPVTRKTDDNKRRTSR